MKISVAEIFASIQGEGPSIGYPSIFLRLAGCNLMCGGQGTQFDKKLHNGATWRCDTIEVWQKGKSYTVEELVDHLKDEFNLSERLNNGWRLIITGGEPLQQSKAIKEFLKCLRSEVDNYSWTQIEFETNGTIWNSDVDWFDLAGCQFNVSPKLSNSGELQSKRYVKENLLKICKLSNYSFKFVCSKDEDVEEVFKDFSFVPKDKIYLMPGASDENTLKEKSQWLAKVAMDKNVKFSSRLQVAIWNETTGV